MNEMMLARCENQKILSLEEVKNRVKKSTEYVDQPVDILDVMKLLKENSEVLQQIKKVACPDIESKKNGYTLNESLIDIKQENEILLKEIDIMKYKLKYCIPVHCIVYMVATAIVFGGALTILFLQICRILYLWDVRYTFGTALGSFGLFITALLSLREWKEFLDEQ